MNGTVDWGTPGNKPRSYPAEYYQSIKEIVEDQDFIFEEHFAETEDGYILGVHRIRSQKFTEAGAPVVFFQHGILSCSTTWVINYSDIAPAF